MARRDTASPFPGYLYVALQDERLEIEQKERTGVMHHARLAQTLAAESCQACYQCLRTLSLPRSALSGAESRDSFIVNCGRVAYT